MAKKANGWRVTDADGSVRALYIILTAAGADLLYVRTTSHGEYYEWEYSGSEAAARRGLSRWKMQQAKEGLAPEEATIPIGTFADAEFATSNDRSSLARQFITFEDENGSTRRVFTFSDDAGRHIVQNQAVWHRETTAWIFNSSAQAEEHIRLRLNGLIELGIPYELHQAHANGRHLLEPDWTPLVSPCGLRFQPVVL